MKLGTQRDFQIQKEGNVCFCHLVLVFVGAVQLLLQGGGSAGQEGVEGLGEEARVPLAARRVVGREDAPEAAAVPPLVLLPRRVLPYPHQHLPLQQVLTVRIRKGETRFF